MIRDRGRIKWTSMMLPEHVKLLRDWAKEDTYETPKELDEQQLEEFNRIVAEATEWGGTVAITHFVQHRHELVMGTIHHWDVLEKKLHIVDQFEQPHYIYLQHIADIQLM